MKNIFKFLFLLLSIITIKVYSQCNVVTTMRSDGVNVKYLNPEMVGKGTGCELGVSISTNGMDYFFNTAVLYFSRSVKSIGSLMIELSSNHSLNLSIYTSELATIENYEVSVNVYFLSNSDVEKLKKATIKKIILKEAGGKYQIIILSKNLDVALRHLNCLN